MIKHIVIWSMKDGVTAEQKAQMKARLEGLADQVSELQKIEVGIDAGCSTMSLCSEFNSAEDLAAYQTHPDHLVVAAFVKSLVAGRTVCDSEV